MGGIHCCEQESKAGKIPGARAHDFLFIHQPPRGRIEKNERLKNREMCDERKSEKRASSEKQSLRAEWCKNHKWERVGNTTRWNRLPVHVWVSCLFCFISILVLSRFECYSMCLGCLPSVFRCWVFFTVCSRRLNTRLRTHFLTSKIKSLCA